MTCFSRPLRVRGPGMRYPDGHVLVALDGSEHFWSRKPHCGQCLPRRTGGGVEYFHSLVCASLVALGQSQALPLAPEFVRPRNEIGKQDCGSCAVQRRPAQVGPLWSSCDRSIWATIPTLLCEAVHAAGGSFIFVCTLSSRRTLSEYLQGMVPQKIHRTAGRASGKRHHRYRWMADLSLRDGVDALRVTRPEVGTTKSDGKVTCGNSFFTDLDIT